MKLSYQVVILEMMMMKRWRDKMNMRRRRELDQTYQTLRTCSGIRSTRLTCKEGVWSILVGVVMLLFTQEDNAS